MKQLIFTVTITANTSEEAAAAYESLIRSAIDIGNSEPAEVCVMEADEVEVS